MPPATRRRPVRRCGNGTGLLGMSERARAILDALAEVAAPGALLFGDGLDVPTPPDRLLASS